MSKKTKKQIKKRVLFFVVIFFLLFVLQAYFLPATSVLGKKAFNYLPLPAIFVNANIVTLGEYFSRLEISDALKKINIQTDEKQQLLNQMVLNKVAENLLSAKGFSVAKDEVNAEYSLLKETTQKPNLAHDYNLSEGEFKDWFVYPDLVKVKLAVWLASNRKLNKEAYTKYDLVMGKVNSGTEFDSLASAYSEDALSAQLGGDLGYLSYKDLIPEYFKEVEAVKDTKVHTAYSRYGIHIFKVLASDLKGPKDSKRYKVQQIFIKTGDFDQWLLAQKPSYTVLRLVR